MFKVTLIGVRHFPNEIKARGRLVAEISVGVEIDGLERLADLIGGSLAEGFKLGVIG